MYINNGDQTDVTPVPYARLTTVDTRVSDPSVDGVFTCSILIVRSSCGAMLSVHDTPLPLTLVRHKSVSYATWNSHVSLSPMAKE